MLRIAKEEEILKNGKVYILRTYTNGTTEEYAKENRTVETEEEPQPTMEELLTEVLLSAEYTACLLEEQMENA